MSGFGEDIHPKFIEGKKRTLDGEERPPDFSQVTNLSIAGVFLRSVRWQDVYSTIFGISNSRDDMVNKLLEMRAQMRISLEELVIKLWMARSPAFSLLADIVNPNVFNTIYSMIHGDRKTQFVRALVNLRPTLPLVFSFSWKVPTISNLKENPALRNVKLWIAEYHHLTGITGESAIYTQILYLARIFPFTMNETEAEYKSIGEVIDEHEEYKEEALNGNIRRSFNELPYDRFTINGGVEVRRGDTLESVRTREIEETKTQERRPYDYLNDFNDEEDVPEIYLKYHGMIIFMREPKSQETVDKIDKELAWFEDPEIAYPENYLENIYRIITRLYCYMNRIWLITQNRRACYNASQQNSSINIIVINI